MTDTIYRDGIAAAVIALRHTLAKAMVDAQNLQGLTPLMVAASNGRAEMVRLLLQYHADPRKYDYTGHDAVDWAANYAAIARALKGAAAR